MNTILVHVAGGGFYYWDLPELCYQYGLKMFYGHHCSEFSHSRHSGLLRRFLIKRNGLKKVGFHAIPTAKIKILF